MSLDKEEKETLRQRLCAFERFLLETILVQRERRSSDQLAAISEETAADTLYAIDKIAEAAILSWFHENWPAKWPVELVMEGQEGRQPLTFPEDIPPEQTALKCLIDPIDGSREIMYDKRSAWILAGIAPQRGPDNTLAGIEVAAMTEIPTTRQWRSDQISATRGGGLKTTTFDVRNNFLARPLTLRPSTADEVHHAFATVSRFFPAGLTLLSQVEESLWARLHGESGTSSPLVFNDHYIATGGQFYEILSGHDRFIADIRPLAFRKLGIKASLTCHPYDVACALILEEAGCVIEKPDGTPLDYPLDTTTPVCWVAYANPRLANVIRPAFQAVIGELLI